MVSFFKTILFEVFLKYPKEILLFVRNYKIVILIPIIIGICYMFYYQQLQEKTKQCRVTSRERINNIRRDTIKMFAEVESVVSRIADLCSNVNSNGDPFCYAVTFYFNRDGFKVYNSQAKFHVNKPDHHLDSEIYVTMSPNSIGDQQYCKMEYATDRKFFASYGSGHVQYIPKTDIIKNSVIYNCINQIADIKNIKGWYVILTFDDKNNLIWGTGFAKRNDFDKYCDPECLQNIRDKIELYNIYVIEILHNHKFLS
jgi:hypothetical protein